MALHLPNEILNQIMGYLIPMVSSKHQESGIQDYRSLRPTDLSSLCLVCQRFHHIAQPLLYHTINITDKTALTHYPHRHKWPGFLLRTIAEQPYLAKYIRVIALSDMVTLHQSPLTGFPWDVPRSIRCALQIALAGEGPNVLPIVLLLYATMVEKIFFCPADVDGVEIPWILTSWRPQGIQSLSRFICPPDFGPDLTLELGPFANYDLPCLKELYVEPDKTDFFYCHSLMDFIKKPGLSTFHLSYGRCTTYFVPQVLEDTPSSLRVLKLENCGLPKPQKDSEQLSKSRGSQHSHS